MNNIRRYLVDVQEVRSGCGCGTVIAIILIISLIVTVITSLLMQIVLGCFTVLGVVCFIWCMYCYKMNTTENDPSRKLSHVVNNNRLAVAGIILGTISAVLLVVSLSLGDVRNDNPDTSSGEQQVVQQSEQ
ncbi:MAG: hypothetical protein ACI4A5_06975 [Hominilimicola sp.]